MRIVFVILFFLLSTMGWTQEIKVIEKENKKTIVQIKTIGNKQIPIYKILAETSGTLQKTTDTIGLHIIELELIGNAPITLEFDTGLYELQFYKNGKHRFQIEATGTDQIWLLKPRGDFEQIGQVTTIVGGIGILASAAVYLFTTLSIVEWDNDLEWYNKDPDFFDPPVGERPTYTIAHIAMGSSVCLILSGVITWLLNCPTASQIK